jgi:hypothetical protein
MFLVIVVPAMLFVQGIGVGAATALPAKAKMVAPSRAAMSEIRFM